MKKVKVDWSKCNGCRMCEVACNTHHLENKFNPKRSRIRVLTEDNTFIPILAGPFTEAECTAKRIVVINGTEYDDCDLCSASCPVRPIFKEPDLDIALKCDFCGEPPNPACVERCNTDALTLVEVP
ncbi:hypothetical protein ACFLTP_00315 [Chloroflexota bacterium]